MDESQRMMFEREFDAKPTRIGGFELLTDEIIGIYIHHGRVNCPIFPAEDDDENRVVDEINPFLLQLTPEEARNLAGLLTYAAGRADETSEHCLGCGDALEEGTDDEEKRGR